MVDFGVDQSLRFAKITINSYNKLLMSDIQEIEKEKKFIEEYFK